jgi:hypothetical protein
MANAELERSRLTVKETETLKTKDMEERTFNSRSVSK